MDFNANDLAEAFFGAENGDAKHSAKLNAYLVQITAVIAQTERTMTRDFSLERFRSEFVSRYQDRFLDVLLARLPSVASFESSRELSLASFLLGSNYYSRWIRTAPSEKVELLFVRLVELWSRACPDLATLFEGPVNGRNVGIRVKQYSTAGACAQLIIDIILQFPSHLDHRTSTSFSSSSTLPGLAQALRNLQRRSITLVNSKTTDPDLRIQITTFMEEPGIGIKSILSYFLQPSFSTEDVRKNLLSTGVTVVWYSCAASMAKAEIRTPCAPLDGKEMMARGRCQSVRYCCKAHQQAHWKKHKNVCFPVEWGPLDL